MWTSSAVIYSQNTALIVLDAEYDGKWSDFLGHPIMIPRGHWGINMVIAYLEEMGK
ncbi:MAG: hypothetical protein IPN55_05260 [Saprospiraceae bacterium]|nr:hypothetical protein [Candidatus Brachybacter algidus]